MKSQPQPALSRESWERATRSLRDGTLSLTSATTEERCQAIGLLCREALISLAQAVTPETLTVDGTEISQTDSKRRLEVFVADQARGSSHDEERTFARASIGLASKLVHQRTATPRKVALCLVATEAAVRVIGLMAGFESAAPRIQVFFAGTKPSRALRVSPSRDDLPSVRYRRRVEAILARRRAGVQHPLESTFQAMRGLSPLLGARPLEAYTTAELEKELRECDPKEWQKHDDYERFGKSGVQLDLSIENSGQSFLEDALITLAIPKAPGLAVAPHVPADPSKDYVASLFSGRGYPDVAEEADRWVVSHQIGDLRHKVVTAAFGEPLRLSVTAEAAGKIFRLECVLHGRQLPDPLRTELMLEVLPPDTAQADHS